MNHHFAILLRLMLFLLPVLAPAANPVVTNITASQRPGTKLVDISYDVAADTPTVNVTLEVSTDGGATFDVPVTSATGAVGPAVAVGPGKTITWNAGGDWNQHYSEQVRYRVTADDGRLPPSITKQPATAAVNSGQTTTLTAIASGTEPLNYQWYIGSAGETMTPVGLNSASFTTPPLTTTTSYWVRISNAVGHIDSNRAIVMTMPEGFAWIPAGPFTLGRTSGDTDQNAPPVTVNISDFFIAKKEITKAEWDTVRAWGLINGYTDLTVGEGKGSNHPVHSVNWYDAVKWCNARSQMEGRMPAYYTDTELSSVYRAGIVTSTNSMVSWSANGYRLPTEAEWEKAARGGVSGKRFPWGTDNISQSLANYNSVYSYSYDDSKGILGYHPNYKLGGLPTTSPVGSFGTNGFGLFDIAGNIREWCWDWYGHTEYYSINNSNDPKGPGPQGSRVYRGGCWHDDASCCRTSYRSYASPGSRSYDFGFRLVCSSGP